MTKLFYLINVICYVIVNMLKGANLKGGGGPPIDQPPLVSHDLQKS